MNDNDDEGFIETKESTMMLDNKKQCQKNLLPHQQIRSTTSKSFHNKPSHYPHLTRNPYDDGMLFIFFIAWLDNSYSRKHLEIDKCLLR